MTSASASSVAVRMWGVPVLPSCLALIGLRSVPATVAVLYPETPPRSPYFVVEHGFLLYLAQLAVVLAAGVVLLKRWAAA